MTRPRLYTPEQEAEFARSSRRVTIIVSGLIIGLLLAGALIVGTGAR